MSVILKGNNITNNSNEEGIGPGEVTNIKSSQSNSFIKLTWTNPSNIVLNNTTLSTFDHVVIVRNTHIPISEKDGTVVYNGKSTTCTDSNVVNNTKYYYRFFVYDTNDFCNNSINMIHERNFIKVDPILKNNSWEVINAVSESGQASSIWNIGDEIDITLSGDYNETVTLQIWDFNHFDKSDGSGKAGICFGMKNLMKDCCNLKEDRDDIWSEEENNRGGWNRTYARNTIMPKIIKSMPANLQNVLKEVDTYASLSTYDTHVSIDTGLLSIDKVFLPGFTELVGNDLSTYWYSKQSDTEKYQKQFPIFTDVNSRIKKMNNGSGNAYFWWTRSAHFDTRENYTDVTTSGYFSYDRPKYVWGMCFCFNV